jgi:hypothetical protein
MSLQDENNMVQYGEKTHMEYGWSKNMRERMIQFHFQLVRTTTSSTLKLSSSSTVSSRFSITSSINHDLF